MLGSFFRKPKAQPSLGLDLPNVDKEDRTEIANLHTAAEADPEIIIPRNKPPLLTSENIALMAILLLLITGTFGIWSWMRYNQLDERSQAAARQHEVMLDSLQQVKMSLENNLDQLQTDFADLSSENDTLAERLATATNIVAEKEAAIQEIKGQNQREEKALREQVKRLQTIKDRYEAIIAVLDQKNARLMAENAQLRGTNDSLFMEISDLGRKLEAQIRQTLSARYKATGFRLEMERRNDKPTIRAKRTRELKVFFELNNVPVTYQGNQALYLVLTNDRGITIPCDNPIDATIKTDKGNMDITAQMTQLQNVIDNQRVVLSYKLEDRLKKGTYLVSVYSEKGLLGVASFRLT